MRVLIEQFEDLIDIDEKITDEFLLNLKRTLHLAQINGNGSPVRLIIDNGNINEWSQLICPTPPVGLSGRMMDIRP